MNKMMRFSSLCVALAVLAGAGMIAPAPASAQGDAEGGASAYDQLKTDLLIKRLSLLGMTDMLQELDRRVPRDATSADALAMRGRVRVGLALAMDDKATRNRLLDEAIPLLQQASKAAEKAAGRDPAKTLKWFEYMMEAAVAAGRYRIEDPHVLRLRYLQGSEKDKEIILKYTEKAVGDMDYLRDEISDTLTEWRPNMELLMLWVPKLEDHQDRVRYNAAWIRLHRALALEKNAERDQLCRDIIADIKKFTNDEMSGVMYWSLYLTGAAYRMLEMHDEAEQFLDKAADPAADSIDVRERALFERARNRIEAGDVGKAEKGIEQFEQTALAIFGRQRKVMVDLRVVFLKNYLFEHRAAASADPAQAEQFRQRAQEVLLSFVEAHADRPKLVRAFLDIIATKFADVGDLDKASAVVILARAYSKIEAEDPQVQAEAIELLQKVLAHEDMANPKIAKAVQPGALWELAFLMNKAKRNSEAAKYFILLARKYPEHNLAFRSAKFAVQSLYAVFQERLDKGMTVPAPLRLEYLRALDTFVAGWPEGDPAAGEPGQAMADVAKWNYDIGTQCARLAQSTEADAVRLYWQSRAIAAYEAVPEKLLEYMESQHAALRMRTDIVLARGELEKLLTDQKDKAVTQLRDLAATLTELESLTVASAVGVQPASPTTAPAESATRPAATTAPATASATAPAMAVAPSQEPEDRALAMAGKLLERLKVYADIAALTQRLQSYAVKAAKESADVAAKAEAAEGQERKDLAQIASGLREWAAEAEYQAAVIKYEQLAKGKEPEEAERIEAEALGDLRKLIEKYPNTVVLPKAFEFEIRKLIERGQTAEAIAKARSFKARYPAKAEQLIKLVVEQIQAQIARLTKRLKDAVTTTQFEETREAIIGYQQAYASFAEDLYQQVASLPFEGIGKLDEAIRTAESLRAKKDLDALKARAKQFRSLAGEFKVPVEEVASLEVLDAVLAAADQPGANSAEILPDLEAAYINAVSDLRKNVLERYALAQMYGDALIAKGKALEMQKETLDAKGSYQKALALFEKCYEIDERRRELLAARLDARYGPRIESISRRATSMDAVREMIDALKAEMVERGLDPKDASDLDTLEIAYKYLRQADSPAEEKQRLPRTVTLLERSWKMFVKDLKNRLVVDHLNVIGLARAHRGLKNYRDAMEQYVRYTTSIPESGETAKAFWRAQRERCECHLEGFHTKDAMNNLVIHIKQLQVKDPSMGGFADDFQRILAEAEEKKKKAVK